MVSIRVELYKGAYFSNNKLRVKSATNDIIWPCNMNAVSGKLVATLEG